MHTLFCALFPVFAHSPAVYAVGFLFYFGEGRDIICFFSFSMILYNLDELTLFILFFEMFDFLEEICRVEAFYSAVSFREKHTENC